MMYQEKLYTAEDLWEISHLPENDGKRMVLIDGVIYAMPPAGWIHGDNTGDLAGHVWLHVKTHKLGRMLAAETGFTLAPGTTLAPDIGFISAARIPEALPDGYIPFAPDLAVEAVSPSNRPDEISLKVEKYLQYGTRMVWVVYPKQKRIDLYRPSGDKNAHVEFLGVNDMLDGGDVLPGFRLALRELFG